MKPSYFNHRQSNITTTESTESKMHDINFPSDFDPSDCNALLSFNNDFDGTWVTIVDEEYFTGGGPYTLRLTHTDPAIGNEHNDVIETHATLSKARARFLELVANEIDAVIAEKE